MINPAISIAMNNQINNEFSLSTELHGTNPAIDSQTQTSIS